MKFKASVIAEFLKGTIEGDPEVEVSDISKIEEGKPGTLCFLANSKYEKFIYDSSASIFIVDKDFKPARKIDATLIKVDNAYESFTALLALYEQSKPVKSGIHKLSAIDESASLGKDIYIGEFAVISSGVTLGNNVKIYPQVYLGDNVTIGDGTILYPGVKVYHDCTIGSECIIHGGVVIGADGFGFNPDQKHDYKKVPHVGKVIIEDNVEIGANTTVDRATVGATIIRKGVKLDNLIMVAHNVEIGQNTVIAGQSGIAGSTKIGKECLLGGQVGLIDHLEIANGVKIAAQSGISKDVKVADSIIQGSPAFDFTYYQKCYLLFKKLPEMKKVIDQLERDVDGLKYRL